MTKQDLLTALLVERYQPIPRTVRDTPELVAQRQHDLVTATESSAST